MNKNKTRIYAVATIFVLAAAILLRFSYLNNDTSRVQQTTDVATTDVATADVATADVAMTEEEKQPETPAGGWQEDFVGYAQTFIAQGNLEVFKDSGDGAFAGRVIRLDDELEQEIDAIVEHMTLEEKVGQMFFIKNDGRFHEEVLEDYPVGGIILFDGDFRGKSVQNLKDYLAAFQANSTYPLLMGVDEEGGTVVRVSRYSTFADSPFRSPRVVYAAGGYEAVMEDAEQKSRLLLSYGINVNFAPVCDVTGNTGDFMYARSFSGDADEASEYTGIVVSVMNGEGMGSVLKHFPGYGNNGDTHKRIVRDTRAYDVFETTDFKPFIAGIEAGAQCILVSHNIVECMDGELPASLSYPVHDILRNRLEFGGVIITDDLVMSGVSDYMGAEESAVQAVLAGNDMILSTRYDVQYQAVMNAVTDGTITEERIEHSVRRILRWKYQLGIMPNP